MCVCACVYVYVCVCVCVCVRACVRACLCELGLGRLEMTKIGELIRCENTSVSLVLRRSTREREEEGGKKIGLVEALKKKGG